MLYKRSEPGGIAIYNSTIQDDERIVTVPTDDEANEYIDEFGDEYK